ncbi:MAG: glycosyl hydrolase 2 galactose-binding domain-containing protein [Flavobacteriales bacterium]
MKNSMQRLDSLCLYKFNFNMNLFRKVVLASAVVTLFSCNSSLSAGDKVGEQLLSGNWKIKPSSSTKLSGEKLSLGEIDDSTSWINAPVPSTIMNAFVQNGTYKNLYEGDNMQKVPSAQFKKSWFYTRSFQLGEIDVNSHYQLNFEGINYKANVWLNGKKIADTNTIVGAFNRFNLLVDSAVIAGKNHIAIELIPPSIGAYTIGFVDWAPTPPDNNMGIFRDVALKITRNVEIKNTFVYSKVNLNTLNEADLFVSTEVVNYSSEAQEITLDGKIENITFSHKISLKANEKKEVKLSSKELPQLHISNPKLWWPNGYGEPNIYHLELSAKINNKVSSSEAIDFGIREVGDYMNEDGHRGYTINGKKILIKGAGWVDDLLLSNTAEFDEAQVKYVKDMNLNCIRFEAFWGKDHTIYNLCDKYGILAMVGFSCQWEWEDYIGTPCTDEFGCAVDGSSIALLSSYWKHQVMWLRNHPSVFSWVGGSDFLPHPDLEKNYISILKEVDPSRTYLASAKTWTSKVSGPSGVKMNGPYDYVPPMYWYTDTVRGGAFGFNTETGPGAQPPVLWTLHKMLGEKPNWPMDSTWNYHHGRHAFKDMNRYMKAFDNRYGASPTVEDFSLFSQAASYEAIRPMFEAFRNNRPNTTGVVQWMLNSAWLDTYWQLYDAYLMPTGAYYGTKISCAPLQASYNYGNNAVYMNNDTKDSSNNVIKIELFDVNSKVLLSKEVNAHTNGNASTKAFDLPKLGKGVSFLSLTVLNKKGEQIASNFYWLSSKNDKMDPNKENASWQYTPAIEFADYTALRKLPMANIKVEKVVKGNEIEVTVSNTSDKIAFFIELIALDDKTKEPARPVFWSDNYISLKAGESKKLILSVPANNINSISIQSLGINTTTIK